MPSKPASNVCDNCGMNSPADWYAPQSIENDVYDCWSDELLCPTCFIMAAKRMGHDKSKWLICPEFHTGDPQKEYPHKYQILDDGGHAVY